MAQEKIDLEQIPYRSSSDEAMCWAIHQLIGKVNLPWSLIERTVEDYENAGRFDVAANVALKAGMTERAEGLYRRAVEDYEKADWFGVAADVALRAYRKII